MGRGVGRVTGIPSSGRISNTARASRAISMIEAGMPAAKNSPLVNCLEL